MKKIIPIIIASLITGQAYATRIINNTPGKMTVSPETVEAGAEIVSRHTYPLDDQKKVQLGQNIDKSVGLIGKSRDKHKS